MTDKELSQEIKKDRKKCWDWKKHTFELNEKVLPVLPDKEEPFNDR